MIIKLNTTEVGIVLSCLKYYVDPDEWMIKPFKKVKTEESKKETEKLYDRINNQSKKEIFG